MTLPTISFGEVDHPEGLNHYAEVTPDGMTSPVRFYATTKDDALEDCWSYLDEHDRVRRAQERSQVSNVTDYTIATLNGIVANMTEEVEALMKAIEFINKEIYELERS